MTPPGPPPMMSVTHTPIGSGGSRIMGANIYPQDVAHGLYEGNPMAGLIEGFCLELDADGDLEARPVVHVQLRKGALLSAVESDRLAKACQYGVLRHLAATSRYFAQSVAEDPSASEIAIRLHAYGSGPFAGNSAIKNGYLLRGGGQAEA